MLKVNIWRDYASGDYKVSARDTKKNKRYLVTITETELKKHDFVESATIEDELAGEVFGAIALALEEAGFKSGNATDAELKATKEHLSDLKTMSKQMLNCLTNGEQTYQYENDDSKVTHTRSVRRIEV